jgi:hypothetical protein
VAKGVGKLGLTGALIVGAAAFAAFAVAIVATTVKLASFALEAAGAAKAEGLMLQAAAIDGGTAVATFDQLSAAVGEVARGVPIARGEVAKLGEQLARAGVAGADFQASLEALAITQSVGGDTGNLLAQLKAAKAAGQSLDALASKVKAKYGAVIGGQMASVAIQLTKAKESFARLFVGVNIDPFVKAFSAIASLLDDSTASGKALKAIFEAILNPLFDGIGKLEPFFTGFLKGLVIGALLLTIAFLKVRNALRDTFGGDIVGQIDWLKTGLYAGVIVVGALAGIFAVLALAVAGAVAPFYLLYKIAKGVWDFFANTEWSQIGTNIVSGIVSGLTAGAANMLATVRNLANGAVDTFKGALGIHSPSTVFAEAGRNTVEGYSQGVDEGAPAANAALAGMVSVPNADAPAKASTSKAGNTNTFTFNIQSTDAKGAAVEVRKMLTDFFEGEAIILGAPLDQV